MKRTGICLLIVAGLLMILQDNIKYTHGFLAFGALCTAVICMVIGVMLLEYK